ncbi:MAG: hypothetical protein JXR88_14160 [Clostridia bacterium]|nr:hypothetical protein [Clostridia bacterium]
MKKIIAWLLVCTLCFQMATFAATPDSEDYNPEEQILDYYEQWKNGNHYDVNGELREAPGYVQSFLLPESHRLPGELEGSNLGAVVVMVPNGTPEELPGDYCVSTDEAMGYGMIIAALMEDQELFDDLYRVVSYYDNFKWVGENEDQPLWEENLTSWAIPAKPGKNWFETDYFKALTDEAKEEWMNDGVQYDPLYLEGTTIKESVIVGEPKNEENCSGSAMDGELDIAYALYLAHDRFETADTTFYLDAARNRFKALFEGIIIPYGTHIHPDGTETLLLPTGDYFSSYEVDGVEITAALTRPCDWMMSHIRTYYNDTGYEPALKLIEDTYKEAFLIKNETTGFMADFYKWVPNGDQDILVPAEDEVANEWLTDYFYMNSARYPFRQTMDTLHYGDQRGLELSLPILEYFYETYGFDEEEDFWNYPYAGYSLDGIPHEDTMWKNQPLNDSLYVTAYATESYQDFLNWGWDDMAYNFTSRYDDWSENGLGVDPYHSGYFGDTWNLLGLLTVSGIWTTPIIHKDDDTWMKDQHYNLEDEVIYKGVHYICVQSHESRFYWIPSMVTALWERKMTDQIVTTWYPQIRYEINDLVEFKGQLYKCVFSHLSYSHWTPDTTPFLWIQEH